MLVSSDFAKFAAKCLATVSVREGTSFGRLNTFLRNESIDNVAKAVPSILADYYKTLPEGVSVIKGSDGKAKVSVRNPENLRPEDYIKIAVAAHRVESK